jgi:hypothetical protein
MLLYPAERAHIPEVDGSIPPPPTNFNGLDFASITVFLNNISFVIIFPAPIPFLLDSIDKIAFRPPIVSGDFDSAFRTSQSLTGAAPPCGISLEIRLCDISNRKIIM